MNSTRRPLLTTSSSEGKCFPPLALKSLFRQLPTAADKDAYELLKNNVPSVESHPHTFAWFVLTSRFTDAVRNTWAAPAAKGGDKKAAPAKKEVAKEEKPVAAATADDDELDLFGDGPTEVSDREKSQRARSLMTIWSFVCLLNQFLVYLIVGDETRY